MSRIGLALAAAAALIVGTTPLDAQAAASAPALVGPTLAAATLSPSPAEVPVGAPTAMQREHSGLTNGQKLMILGGAVFITGAIIGDTPGTIIMIGGAAVGLYGLYVQLGHPHTGTPTRIGYSYTF